MSSTMCRGIEIDHFVGEPTCPLGDQCENPDSHSLSIGEECEGPDVYTANASYCQTCRDRLTPCDAPVHITDDDLELCALGHDVTDYERTGHWHPRTVEMPD